MSNDSLHGRWSISDSEDEDVIPPTPQKQSKSPIKSAPDSKLDRIKQEPIVNPKRNESDDSLSGLSAVPMGSEARKTAHVNQTNPVKYEHTSSVPVKRKRDTEEADWNLSSSDDETQPSAPIHELKKINVSPKRRKTEEKRPPSPHGTGYYKEEPADFFETNLVSVNDMYRFYLNKVSGIPKKFNTGALHIREILSPMFGTLKESVQFNYCFDIPWMVEQFPPEFRNKPVVLVHGEKRESKARLIEQAKPFPHIRFCQAKLDIAFGTHHT
ncbi:hypothetical protein DNTS_014091 [Danionella cerebrum]|uniref:Tyrosyl-DNA phosphodiesterase 1 n=1 Tax=Danionella cerebrum TaxID=2873325 RepID=A0A553QT27_9TELE|nr:hypothetical protein DNTS_014091 [Danionella translucida]